MTQVFKPTGEEWDVLRRFFEESDQEVVIIHPDISDSVTPADSEEVDYVLQEPSWNECQTEFRVEMVLDYDHPFFAAMMHQHLVIEETRQMLQEHYQERLQAMEAIMNKTRDDE